MSSTPQSAGLGTEIYSWVRDLFPICRSITGDGVRETLRYFQKIIPEMQIREVPSGTAAFDWTVPDEWNIRDAFVADEDGNRIIDFRENNLHVVGYSEPVDTVLSFGELDKHLYSLEDQPDAIPYITSYYKRRWGFCLTHAQRRKLAEHPERQYRVFIDSTLQPGNLTYGEVIIPGETEQEILLSSYICHPSMANNELSGPCVAAAIARWLGESSRRYTYRILFLVETIGSIVYLSRHHDVMKQRTAVGFVLTCMGDDHAYSYVASRKADTLADRISRHTLRHHAPDYLSYSFLDRGSDERQYCSPGIDLPVCSIMRSKYGVYPEYHTSLDDLSYVSESGLFGGFEIIRKAIAGLEGNLFYRTTVPCEPQLGKRGLYPTLSTKETKAKVQDMMNFFAYADGTTDLLTISDLIGCDILRLIDMADGFVEHGLMERSARPLVPGTAPAA